MKTKNITLAIGLSTITALTAFAGPPTVIVTTPAPVVTVPAPVVTVPAPTVVTVAPATTVVATVPDSYVWDGVEFVGVIGTQYYYLGPNKVWLAADAPRLVRFHDWERTHADWRAHAIRNELYRRDAHGQTVPFHDDHDHGHDVNHLHNH